MGTGETVISKPSKPTSSSQEIPSTPYPDWSSSVQAYYAAGAPPSPFFPSPMAPPSPHPYMWRCQYPMMLPYGTPIPYPPAMYPPGGFYYHPPITMAHSPAPKNPEATEDQVPAKKSKEVAAKGKDGNGGKAVSVSGSDDVSPSDESRTEEDSSYGTDENANQQENAASRKGSFRQMLADAAGSRNKATSAVQASSDGKPVHMRMDLRSSSTGVPANFGSNASGAIVPAPMPEQRIQDERELKRQKRKQSNRESAKRSRLRKLAEFEELEQRVGSLTDENGSLREELQRLAEECEKLTTVNNTTKDVLTQLGGQEAVANLEQPTSPDLPSNDEGNS